MTHYEWLANLCWKNTWKKHPVFCQLYLQYAKQLLQKNPTITGDAFQYRLVNEFRLRKPVGATDNIWPSAVVALERLGWIEPIGVADPVYPRKSHNAKVVLWRSALYLTPKKP